MESPPRIGYGGNGADGNGHHETIGIGPTVELQPGIDRHANGNGHHDEAPEPPARPADRQQSLFSLGGVHGRRAGEAQGLGPKAAARKPLDVRVGDDSGTAARGRACGRGSLDRKTKGRASLAMPSPGRSCMPLFLQLRPVPLPWPGHMCLLFPLPLYRLRTADGQHQLVGQHPTVVRADRALFVAVLGDRQDDPERVATVCFWVSAMVPGLTSSEEAIETLATSRYTLRMRWRGPGLPK